VLIAINILSSVWVHRGCVSHSGVFSSAINHSVTHNSQVVMASFLRSGVGRKRPRSPTQSSNPTKVPQRPFCADDRDSDFLCPMCFNIINDAYVTKCGHSFCHVCIEKSLKESNRCPKCNLVIDKADQIFPNFSLNELISKYKRQERSLCKNKV
jgi:E3 ubiquitin-protein ligase RFWD2